MSRTYQVLRNNRQTGPYTLEELRSLQLQDHDLIWAEGQAGGWRSPSEVRELSGEPEIQSRESVVRSGETAPEESADFIEAKAAMLHARMQAYMAEQQKGEEEGEPHTRYVRSLDQLRKDYADWLHEKHHKRASSRVPVTVLIAVILFCSGFLASRWYYEQESGVPDERLTAEERERLRPQPAILTEEVPTPHAAYAPPMAANEAAGRDSEGGSREPGAEVSKPASGKKSWRADRLKPKAKKPAAGIAPLQRSAKKKAMPADTTRPTVADLVNKYLGNS